jgi:micrococcal nuclease
MTGNIIHSKKGIRLALFYLVLTFFLTGCFNASEEGQGKSLVSATVVKISDGDTIKVNINGKTESVRFLLVDTPELGKQPQPFAEEAKNFTQKLLSEAPVYLEKDVSERDKYGRLLMYIYTQDGRSVSEELLKEGLARVAYVYAPNTKYVEKYYAIQKEAQNKGVGIWSVENYAQEDGYHIKAFEKEQKVKRSKSSTSFTPDHTGSCNGQIKGNQGSNGWIYHVPDGAYYNNTKAEECFNAEQAAKNGGYRKSSR